MIKIREAARDLDKLALAIGAVGVVGAILVDLIGRLADRDWDGPAFALFAIAQVAAIVLGVMSRRSPLGKVAAIASGLLLVVSLGMM